MELRKINTQDAFAQWEYTTALPADENGDENGLTNPYNGVSYDEYVEKVLPELISYEHPVNMPEWFVPETYYYLWDDGHLVGEFRIRHHLTQALRTGAGHIGYSILKGVRGKGYGTEGLRLTVMIAKDIIPEDEIYLRVNKAGIVTQYGASSAFEYYFSYYQVAEGGKVNQLYSASYDNRETVLANLNTWDQETYLVMYTIPGYQGSIGLISAIHGKFCDKCNRIRLTSTGFLKGCLCYNTGADLREILRANEAENEKRRHLTETMEAAIYAKPRAHCFESAEDVTERATMNEIGG